MKLRVERVVVIDCSRHGLTDLNEVAPLRHPVLHPGRAPPRFHLSAAQASQMLLAACESIKRNKHTRKNDESIQ